MRFKGNYFLVYLCFSLLVWGEAFAESQRSITVRDLAGIRDIGGGIYGGAISVSPDGKWVAFQVQVPNIPERDFDLFWMTIPTSGDGKPVYITDGGDLDLDPVLLRKDGARMPVRAIWAPSSKTFAYKLKQNNETQIWLSRPGRQGQKQLTQGSRSVIDFVWSSDGSKLYYQTGLDKEDVARQFDNEDSQGFLFDDRFQPSLSSKVLSKFCYYLGASPVVFGLERDCEPSIWVYDFKSKSERRASDEEKEMFQSLKKRSLPEGVAENRSVHSVRQLEASAYYAWLENEDPDTYLGHYPLLRVHALVGDRIISCAAIECSGYAKSGYQDFWWGEDGREVFFLRRDGSSHSKMGIYAWAPLTGGIRTIHQSEDRLSDCALAREKLICLYETWTSPRKIVSVFLGDGRLETLYDPNPEFSDLEFTKVEKLEWEDKFGNPTHGHLVYPRNYEPGQAYPLVFVTYRSRGFLRGGVGDEYPVHPLAAEGFFVLSHEIPLYSEVLSKEKDPSIVLFKDLYWRKATLSSQEKIATNLIERGLVDARRIAITGLSEGSAQTIYALIHSSIFATGISSSMSFSPSAYYMMNEKNRQFWRRLLRGAPDDPGSYWSELSIGLNVDKIRTPLLVNVSEEEMVNSVESFSRLKDSGNPVEMYVFSDAYHNKWRPDQRLNVYRRNIQWLKFWFKGEIESDPASTGQYERWFRLCQLHMKNMEALEGDAFREIEKMQFCLMEHPDTE